MKRERKVTMNIEYTEEGEVIYNITNPKKYVECDKISNDLIKDIFDFAFKMTFGREGHHRPVRSGGERERKSGQIFADAFLGKLAEFAFYSEMKKYEIFLPEPDLNVYGENIWDTSDFKYYGKNIALKATKDFGNLLLLETKDWNNEGEYIPNIESNESRYDYFVFVRIKGKIAEILKSHTIYYLDALPINITRDNLEEMFLREDYSYEITGYMTIKTLKFLIEKKVKISKGSYINKVGPNNRMDAENYYLQTGSLKDKNSLVEKFLGLDSV